LIDEGENENEGPVVLHCVASVLLDSFVPVLLFAVVDVSGVSVGGCVAVLTILFPSPLCDDHFFPGCGRSSHDASKTTNDGYADDSSGHRGHVGALVCPVPSPDLWTP